MKNIQLLTDKFAIGLSVACTIHCLLFPSILVLLPAVSVFAISDEMFHFYMLAVVIPSSLFALTLGCSRHKHYRVFLVGMVGIAVLTFTAIFGHDFLGETSERVASVIGSLIVASGHFFNYKLCKDEKCGCDSSNESESA